MNGCEGKKTALITPLIFDCNPIFSSGLPYGRLPFLAGASAHLLRLFFGEHKNRQAFRPVNLLV
jgi:hypothetical protein